MAANKRAWGLPKANGVRRLVWLSALLAFVWSAHAQDRAASDAPQADAAKSEPAAEPSDKGPETQAHLLRIDLPITGDIDMKVRQAVMQLLGKLPPHGPRPVLIVELAPGSNPGGLGSDFSRALSLAQFLSSPELARLKTVAYIPQTIKGHAVLVAMACEQIVMDENAEIGEAGIDEQVIGPTIRSGYAEIAGRRLSVPLAIALAMLDRDVKALRVTTEVGTEYVLEDELEKIKERNVVQSVEPLRPQPLLVDGRKARSQLGFVSALAKDRAELARRLDLPLSALEENPALVGGWRPVQVGVKGPITPKLVERIKKMISDEVRNNDANLVVVRLESDGGSFPASNDLAQFLLGHDPGKVRTVAYIPNQAKGDASIIASACDQIVMHPSASLGGYGAATPKADMITDVARSLRKGLVDDGRSWSLPVAMFDPALKVYRYTQPATGLVAYYSEDEVAAQPDPKSWRQGELVTNADGPLQLSGRRAEELGVAWKVVDNFDQFKQAYGLEKSPGLVEPGWADFLIDALSSDGARIFLLVLGFAGLYLELNTPGLGIGGFVSLVCFLLYFWAQHLQGTAAVLEILLFLAGVLCLALEIFILPGFGIFGLGGGLLVIASLILASQTFVIPTNEYQVEKLRNSLLVLGGAAGGVIVTAILIRRFLPHTPVLNRMLLAPPSGEELAELSHRESLANFQHLLGKQGVATTPLMLSGKARIGDALVDVVADGEAIDRGTPVVVVEASGSRVVVRAVQEA